MERQYSTRGSFIQAAKVAIATLPALAILLIAAIALGTQPSSATARKPVGVPNHSAAVSWPALGAGDFESVEARFPAVVWPAAGAGDFEPAATRFPVVNWPAPGAGDFEATK